MPYNYLTNIENCYSNIPSLLYYSHIPTAIVPLILGLFVFYRAKNNLSAKLLLLISILFSLWSVLDILIWVSPNSMLVMFTWSIVNLVEILISTITLYFTYVYIEKKEPPLWVKLIFSAIILSFALFIPTAYNLPGFDISNCEAIQGPLINYFYVIEIFNLLVLLSYLIYKIFRTNRDELSKVAYFSIGVILFSLSFSGANLIGSLASVLNPNNPDNWKILQYGLFGMPVFNAFLVYLIVKYKAFNLRLLGAQALVWSLAIIIAAQFFFIKTTVNQVLTFITLLIAIIIGYFLVRGVKQEIAQREHIEEMAVKLSVTNERLKELDKQKTEFVSIASHQLRSPLTAIRGYASMLLEGSFGPLGEKAREATDRIYDSSQRLVSTIEDFLNITRIELGKMKYEMADLDLAEIVKTVVVESKPNIDKKGLVVKFDELAPGCIVRADSGKISQVINNLIDNAIKYTKAGTITIKLVKEDGKARLSVSDTGIGIRAEVLPKLFKKFLRADDAGQTNIAGTGLGLYVAKQIVEGHGGRIWAESAGEGKGSTFFVELKLKT